MPPAPLPIRVKRRKAVARLHRRTVSIVRTFLPMTFLMAVSLGLTGFILLNSLELLFSTNLPFAEALNPVPVETFVKENALTGASTDDFGSFGAPAYVKLGTQKIRIQVVPAVQENNTYLARAAASHYIILGPNKDGNLGNVFIYLRQSWRTARAQDTPVVGQNIFVDTTDDWRYMYRISEIVTLPYESRMVSPDSSISHLTMGIVDEERKEITYITGDFVTLQNIAL